MRRNLRRDRALSPDCWADCLGRVCIQTLYYRRAPAYNRGNHWWGCSLPSLPYLRKKVPSLHTIPNIYGWVKKYRGRVYAAIVAYSFACLKCTGYDFLISYRPFPTPAKGLSCPPYTPLQPVIPRFFLCHALVSAHVSCKRAATPAERQVL